MQNVRTLRPSRLRNIKQGEFFRPVSTDDSRFLAGVAGGVIHLIELDGREPFFTGAADEFSRGTGLIELDVEFEVDPASAEVYHGPASVGAGSLVMDDEAIGVIAFTDRSTFPVFIRGDGVQDFGTAIAFARWRIVRTDGKEKSVLFSHGCPRAVGSIALGEPDA